ncbi:MAG: nucleotidyl transferase AbiEii/AbiGii toxin family protein [Lachnospiraceae bacterium]|nr:nucleotidyl transferase AbiEii/AbiGii toxin family protein [Lachnospiraceae bacterium]MBR4059526.1 nucleotidyl transferase AbiEii/AbiGii toxin family protein [Lachnospiraceae bacterium]
MNLHHDKEALEELIIGAANELAIPTNVIEKDYYVTITLKALSEKVTDLVFKGGTSLTKCYQLLDRFSEDIDLSYTAESGMPGESRKKQLKKAIVSTMEEFDFPINNLENTRSRRNYNCYRANYPSMYEQSSILKPELVVETYVAMLPFPTTKRMVDNYIYRFLKKINRLDLAENYNLMPFEITTQTIERTLVDKVFALCDYYMDGKTERHSRHLYDIHKIVESVGISGELSSLIPEVRVVRAELSVCPSAKPGVCVTEILHEVIEKQVYKGDYEDITMGLLFVPESYDTVIQSLKKIADSELF